MTMKKIMLKNIEKYSEKIKQNRFLSLAKYHDMENRIIQNKALSKKDITKLFPLIGI
jgi:hypothetical protein